VLDLEYSVDFFQRESSGLDVKEPHNRKPCEIENCENDIEAPANCINALKNTLASYYMCRTYMYLGH
jgi:hypothetical protein